MMWQQLLTLSIETWQVDCKIPALPENVASCCHGNLNADVIAKY